MTKRKKKEKAVANFAMARDAWECVKKRRKRVRNNKDITWET